MKLFYSMLRACICGIIIASVLIFCSKYISYQINNKQTTTETLKEKVTIDQNSSFVSSFSRVFTYNADNGNEIIKNAINSISKNSNVKISAQAYVVADLDRNVILIEKNSEKLLPIASVTKLVTAIISKKLLEKDKYITINSKDLSTYGNEAKFRMGEKFKIDELLYPLLMVSSNDASEALARSYIKGRRNFINEMNLWLNSIGAYRTYFADPSGLSPSNVSTAKDLSIITRWIIQNEPDIFNITLLKFKIIRTHTWTNPTHFLNISYYVGGKNGYTEEANRTSIALFRLGNQKKLYVVILLSSSNRDRDILDLLEEALK